MTTYPGQLDIFASAPFAPHSTTSHHAALAVYEKLPRRRREVFDFIAAHPGVTDQQIADGMGLDGSSVRPRRQELEKAGLIVDDGHGTTRAGNLAVRWKVSP